MRASRRPTSRTRSEPRRSPRSSAHVWRRRQKERPFGYLVREAPADDVKSLQQLAGHLTEDWFITKFRKIFARDEMNDDLLIVPARYNGAEDNSEYEEMLPIVAAMIS